MIELISLLELIRITKSIMTGPAMKLLESVAENICDQVLRQHPGAMDVQVHVRKLCIPSVDAIVQSVGGFLHVIFFSICWR